MKVEVWSDIVCPFCYIGKRNFEKALQDFEHAGEIQVEWKSFQLDPDMVPGTGENLYNYLARRKGISYNASVQMHQQVTQTAAAAGLAYHFDKAIVASSFNAHRVIQLAKEHSLGDAMEEQLFKAYFTEGLNIDDKDTLVALASNAGINSQEVTALLESNTLYSKAVSEDIAEATQLGIRGVPFFIFNRKYAVSGAQPPEVFREALLQSFNDWQQFSKTEIEIVANNSSCSIQGNCID